MAHHCRSQQLSTLAIVLMATGLASWWVMNRPSLKEKWLFIPYRVAQHGEWHRLFSHAFIHADFTHLLVNLFVLWQFGAQVEFLLDSGVLEPRIALPGQYTFFLLYIGGIFAATIPGMVRHGQNPHYRSLGASGAVSAVLIAYILEYPTAQLYLFFAIPMPAFAAGFLFFVYERYMDRKGQTRVAHDAHLWGGLFGLIFVLLADADVVVKFSNAVIGYLN